MASAVELVIKPHKGWQAIDLKEVRAFQDLFFFLVWRDLKVRYRQTALGAVWAIVQPLVAMLIFTLIFHRLAGVNSDGAPYPLFAFAGVAPWTFFSTAVSQSSNSLIGNQQLVAKIYFPRFFIPLASITALLLDLGLSICLLAVLIVYYHWHVSFLALLWLPVFVVAAFLAAGGIGLVLSALNVSFRDVKYAVPFLIQMGIFVTPVIYPIRYVPHRWHLLVALNPMAGVVIGFRHALLGSEMPWNIVGWSLAVSIVLFAVGLMSFRRMERRFADII